MPARLSCSNLQHTQERCYLDDFKPEAGGSLLRKRTSLPSSTQHKLGIKAAISLATVVAPSVFTISSEDIIPRNSRASSQVLNLRSSSQVAWYSTSMCTGSLSRTTVPVRLRPWSSNKIVAPTHGNSGVFRCLWARPRSGSDKRLPCTFAEYLFVTPSGMWSHCSMCRAVRACRESRFIGLPTEDFGDVARILEASAKATIV